MPEWLRRLNWLQETGSALIAILPMVAAVSLSAFLATWLGERRRVRREHLAAIKAEVFRPLGRELEEFYLPLLRGKIGPVTIEHVATQTGGTALTDLGRVHLRGAKPAEAGELSRFLYVDAKCQHYGRLFRRLELFKSEVDAYTRLWVSYAEQLSQTITEQVGLPVMTEADPLYDTEWIDSDGLAVFVVNCQLGIARRPLCVGLDGRSIEINGVPMVRAAAEDRVQRSLKALEALSGRQETPDELRPRTEPLLHLAKYLLRELDRLRVSSKLPGGCRLVRP